jgi:uncharacterized protein YcnI
MKPLPRRLLVVAGVGLAALAASAGAACAHVSVDPGRAEQGGFVRLALRVPNESDSASTTRVQVQLPEAQPLASVSTQPVPGWTAAVQRRTLDQPLHGDDGDVTEVVSLVTWTATPGAGIRPGEFQEFPLSVGPLPRVDSMVFKTLQTYSDGTVVRWIEEAGPGEAEPEHPAPVLRLTAAGGAGGPDERAAAAPGTAVGARGADASARWLAGGGLVAGLLGLGLGALALARTRRPRSPGPTGSPGERASA